MALPRPAWLTPSAGLIEPTPFDRRFPPISTPILLESDPKPSVCAGLIEAGTEISVHITDMVYTQDWVLH